MKYLIGLDIGTSAVKGALMTEYGKTVTTAKAGFTYIIDGDARFLKPDEFCETCFSVIKELADIAGKSEKNAEIAAICSCCAAGNPLFLGDDMQPLTDIIGWQTKVSWDILDRVYTKAEQDAFYENVGWGFFDGMPAANLAEISVKHPEILKKTRFLAFSSEYMNYLITGKWGITHSMGTPTYLIDQEEGVYNKQMLSKFGLREDMLPPIYEKGTVLGNVLPETAEKLGVSADTKIVLGTFDHPSGALGAGVLKEGEMLLSCGTSWVEFFPVSDRKTAISTGGLVDRFLLKGAPYCVMKSLESISDLINERRERLLGIISHREFDELIEASEPDSGGLVFDYTDDDYERAKVYGKPEIAREIIAGAARLLRDNLTESERFGLRADNITAVGGITNSPVCVKLISDILGKPVKVVNGQSAGAVGSCLLAGIGIGLFESESDAVSKMRSCLNDTFASARKVFHIESECISRMEKYFDEEAYMKAVSMLINAQRIGASGCGHSGIICQHFAHLMCCIEQSAKFISPAEAVHGGMGFLQAGDVCIFASRGGKTAELIPMAEICIKKGIKIIVITENIDSPLAKMADVVIKQYVNMETDRYNCQGTTSSTSLAVIFHILQTMIIEETGFQNESFALVHPNGAVGERLNKK